MSEGEPKIEEDIEQTYSEQDGVEHGISPDLEKAKKMVGANELKRRAKLFLESGYLKNQIPKGHPSEGFALLYVSHIIVDNEWDSFFEKRLKNRLYNNKNNSMSEGEPKIEEEKEDIEIGNFPDSMTDEEIATHNLKRKEAGYPPLRRATVEEKAALDIGGTAVEYGRGRKYTPAVVTKDGKVFTGAGHGDAIAAASEAHEEFDRRGWVTQDGKFLGLLDVARLEMEERGKVDDKK